MTPPRVFKLAPSDLTFLWAECQACFWMKVHGVIRRPSAPFPKVFTVIDGLTKDHFYGRRTEEISNELPPGKIAFGDRWVRSQALEVPGHDSLVTIAGKIDTAATFDDGSYGVLDFKTSEPKPEHVFFYSRQLHCYAVAAENPRPGALELKPVTRLGLLCVEPVGMDHHGDGVALMCDTTYLPIAREDTAFVMFLDQVLHVLEQPTPPEPNPNCQYCRFVKAGSLRLITGIYEAGF